MKAKTKAKSRAPKTAKTKAPTKAVKKTKAVKPKTKTVEKTEKAASGDPVGKLGIILDLVKQPDGATVEALMKATGWQSHSVRAALTHQLRKKRGYQIVTQKAKGEATVYKL